MALSFCSLFGQDTNKYCLLSLEDVQPFFTVKANVGVAFAGSFQGSCTPGDC